MDDVTVKFFPCRTISMKFSTASYGIIVLRNNYNAHLLTVNFGKDDVDQDESIIPASIFMH